MLSIIADCYTPLLVFACALFLKPVINRVLFLSFVAAFAYVYLFAFIESYLGWWLSLGEDFSSHTAFVMVMVFALLSFNVKMGIYALISAFGYGLLMNTLNYHSWFDILTTMLVCSPCYVIFILAKKRMHYCSKY